MPMNIVIQEQRKLLAVAVIHSNDFDVVQFSHLVCTSLCLFVFIKNAPFSRFALK